MSFAETAAILFEQSTGGSDNQLHPHWADSWAVLKMHKGITVIIATVLSWVNCQTATARRYPLKAKGY
jgi:hypothetical protein